MRDYDPEVALSKLSINRTLALGLSHKGLEAAVVAELQPLPHQKPRSVPNCQSSVDFA